MIEISKSSKDYEKRIKALEKKIALLQSQDLDENEVKRLVSEAINNELNQFLL